MRRRTLWWTRWPSVHLHCEPQNHELKSHYREWGRDRDAGHLFAWTFCGLLAGYICGRVDRSSDIDPSTEVLLLYSWLLLAASHGLWHCYLCWHRISCAASQWERLHGVWIQILGGNLLPWSMEWGQCDTFEMAWGPKCYNIQLGCLGAGAALHDTGGDDFHHTEHLLAPQSSPEGGNISWSVCFQKGAGATSCDHSASGAELQPDQRTIFLIRLSMISSCGLRQVGPPLVSPPGFSPPGWQ